jgi:hypothetical protein
MPPALSHGKRPTVGSLPQHVPRFIFGIHTFVAISQELGGGVADTEDEIVAVSTISMDGIWMK